MTDLDILMEAAYRSVHCCDLCGVLGCENFTETVGDMRPCSQDADGLWLCDLCKAKEAVPG